MSARLDRRARSRPRAGAARLYALLVLALAPASAPCGDPPPPAAPIEVRLHGTALGVDYDITIGPTGQLHCAFRYGAEHPLFRGTVSADGQLDAPGLAGFRRAIGEARLGELPAEFGAGTAGEPVYERALEVREGGASRRVRDLYARGRAPGEPERAADAQWQRFDALYENAMELCPATPMPTYLRYE